MRYFLLCLAAFVLLAVPAFAAAQDVSVTVEIKTIGEFGIGISHFSGGVILDEYSDFAAIDPCGLGQVDYWVKTNSTWKLTGDWDADTNWPVAWGMRYKTVGAWTAFTGGTDILDSGDDDNFVSEKPCELQITGIAWPQGPIVTGGHIHFTLGNY